VVNLITFYAQEVREILASIGARSLDEVIGRADLLTQVSRGAAHLDDLDLNPLLITVDGAAGPSMTATSRATRCPTRWTPRSCGCRAVPRGRREDAAVLRGAEHAPDHRHAHVSSHIVRRFGMRNACSPTT
jgi:glutamate synthase (NADPH/NADH) large chain